uniref:Reverse transcriptase zinc-binding domain-containing protein n=1 Tax=Brassica campestris TaxID=3711 RepID=A0A3P6A9A7_BRACM|nr:unnamed protein product [Brassica rapa]
MEVKTSNSPSFGWKSIMAAQDLLCADLRRRIGSGYNTREWSDSWIPVTPPRPPKDNVSYRDHDMFVNQLIDQSSKTWKVEVLQSLFDPGDIPLIRSLRLSHNFSDDGFCWIFTKSGAYTVKSGYKLAINHLLFTCPPALQTWLLSDIPTVQGSSRVILCTKILTTSFYDREKWSYQHGDCLLSMDSLVYLEIKKQQSFQWKRHPTARYSKSLKTRSGRMENTWVSRRCSERAMLTKMPSGCILDGKLSSVWRWFRHGFRA